VFLNKRNAFNTLIKTTITMADIR